MRKDSEITMHEQNCLVCGSRHHKASVNKELNIKIKSSEGTPGKEKIKNETKIRSVKSIKLRTRGKDVDKAKYTFVCFCLVREVARP